jgi:hypothetical protein
MGFAGTWFGRRIISKYGLLQSGVKALGVQVILLGLATVIYTFFLSGSPEAGLPNFPAVAGIPVPVVAFAGLVVASRMGMWSYDMVNAQLFQQTVPQREVASASSAEMALCSFSELIMLGLAAYVITPSSYSTLIYGSFGAVVTALLIFSVWAGKGQQSVEVAMRRAIV